MEIIWSPRATAEFEARMTWLEQMGGQRQALHFLQEVMGTLDKITNPIAAYRLVMEDPETRCCPVNKLISLYYRPMSQAIELVSFFDTRQNPNKLKI